jgi:hypothetical protein
MKSRLLLIAVLFTMVSCLTTEVCDDNSQSELVVRFKTEVSESVSDTLIAGVSIYGIREGRVDSLLYDSSELYRIVLPLDPHHSYSRFVMKINEISDTLTLVHNTGFYLISYTCGYGGIFTLDPDSIDHGHKLFYDIKLIDAVIDAATEQDDEHLWLYF